jgi:hypothetical protein
VVELRRAHCEGGLMRQTGTLRLRLRGVGAFAEGFFFSILAILTHVNGRWARGMW